MPQPMSHPDEDPWYDPPSKPPITMRLIACGHEILGSRTGICQNALLWQNRITLNCLRSVLGYPVLHTHSQQRQSPATQWLTQHLTHTKPPKSRCRISQRRHKFSDSYIIYNLYDKMERFNENFFTGPLSWNLSPAQYVTLRKYSEHINF